jgi:4-hydroxysphinganine ceramide fatty acyl 2-hydroxylase
MMRATPESPRMFESDFVDLFSRVPWWALPPVWVPVIAGLFGYGLVGAHLGVGLSLALAVVGFVVWTLVEYSLHRSLFHWTPKASWGPRFHFILHGVHHDWVNDKYRLVMPPAASAALAAVFFVMWWAVLGAWVFPFFAGHVAGYLTYDLCHYYLHHGRPKAKWLIRLRAHHMNHHHNKEGRKYGVSTTLWDHVFRTY